MRWIFVLGCGLGLALAGRAGTAGIETAFLTRCLPALEEIAWPDTSGLAASDARDPLRPDARLWLLAKDVGVMLTAGDPAGASLLCEVRGPAPGPDALAAFGAWREGALREGRYRVLDAAAGLFAPLESVDWREPRIRIEAGRIANGNVFLRVYETDLES